MMDGDLRDRVADQAYRDHATDVYRVAYGILRDRDEALDATHDAFARAWERWEQYDSQRPLRAWLHGIVVHLALDQLRRRKVRRLAVPVLGRIALRAGGSAVGGDPATDFARRQVVEDAMATLRPDARAVLVLRHYYGYDYAQIATFLDTNSGTVGSILSRAHAALRVRLQGEAGGTQGARAVYDPANQAAVERSPEPPEVLP